MKDIKAKHSIRILDQDEFSVFCAHGPCLLFERKGKGSSEAEKFYACSVYRSRKLCNFFLKEDDFGRKKAQYSVKPADNTTVAKELYAKLSLLRKAAPGKRGFCSTCQQLIVQEETSTHNGHKLEWGITNVQLKTPTKLIAPLDNKDAESQFWFSKESSQILLDAVDKQNFDGVLCIGAPRFFELLNGPAYIKKTKSFLLDYDLRFAQFYSPRSFAQYNMIANYFYGCHSVKKFESFLETVNRLLIVVDPPFGALCCQIAKSIKSLEETFTLKHKSNDMVVKNGQHHECVWVSPYFLQSKIIEHYPEMKMLAYQVRYENHPIYKMSGKKGSPIRIFTTLSPSVFVPPDDKYKFCNKCDSYVAKECQHCDACNLCASKNGKSFIHCKRCNRCVKPTYIHCKLCSRCHLKDRSCSSDTSNNCPVEAKRAKV